MEEREQTDHACPPGCEQCAKVDETLQALARLRAQGLIDEDGKPTMLGRALARMVFGP